MSELPSKCRVCGRLETRPCRSTCSAAAAPSPCSAASRLRTGLLPPVEKRPCPGSTEACRDTTEEIELSQASCFPDMATRREVARLKVLCPNRGAGCSVALRWSLMDQHLDSCDFQALPCELCGQQVARRDMQRHCSTECLQRTVSCELCSQQVPFGEMESRHRNLESDVCCPRLSAACPHCGDRSTLLDRTAYLAHLSDCPEKPVECKYSHLGCDVRVSGSNLQRHYEECIDSHLMLIDARLYRQHWQQTQQHVLQQIQLVLEQVQQNLQLPVIHEGHFLHDLVILSAAVSADSPVQLLSNAQVLQIEVSPFGDDGSSSAMV